MRLELTRLLILQKHMNEKCKKTEVDTTLDKLRCTSFENINHTTDITNENASTQHVEPSAGATKPTPARKQSRSPSNARKQRSNPSNAQKQRSSPSNARKQRAEATQQTEQPEQRADATQQPKQRTEATQQPEQRAKATRGGNAADLATSTPLPIRSEPKHVRLKKQHKVDDDQIAKTKRHESIQNVLSTPPKCQKVAPAAATATFLHESFCHRSSASGFAAEGTTMTPSNRHTIGLSEARFCSGSAGSRHNNGIHDCRRWPMNQPESWHEHDTLECSSLPSP